jgi:hypothetical protein
MNQENTYLFVGHKAGLEGNRLVLYIAYMKARWEDSEEPKCRHGYAMEWAERFKRGAEYCHSNGEGQKLLDKLYKEKELYKRSCAVTWLRDNGYE